MGNKLGSVIETAVASSGDGAWPAGVEPLFRWQPAYVVEGDIGHIPLLYWLACQLRPELAISLGVGDGAGHFALCEAAQTCGFPAQIFGIDRWDAPGAGSLAAVPAPLAAHAALHHAGRSRLICADPDDAADFFDLGNIGLLVVDLPLSAELVEQLSSVWVPLMAQTSAIVVRNVVGDLADDVVARLDDLRAAHRHLMFNEGAGVLVVASGRALPAPLEGLLARAAEDQGDSEILGALRWIGAALADRQGYAVALAEKAQLGLAVRAEQDARTKVAQQQAALEQELVRQEAQRAEYIAQLGARDAAIAELTGTAETQAAALAAAEDRNAAHMEALRELTARAEAVLQEKAQIERERDALQAAVTEKQQAVTKAQSEAARARKAAATATAALAKLREDMAQQVAGRDAALALAAEQAQAKAQTTTDLEAVVDRQRKELVVLTKMAERQAKGSAPKVEHPAAVPVEVSTAAPDVQTNPAAAKPSRLKSLTFGLRLRGTHTPSLGKQAEALKQSVYFDSAWYAKTYPDCGGPAKAAMHYLREGAFVGNDPGPRFSTTGYYQRNPDVASSDWAALAHYVFYGKAEGRVFDPLAPDEVI